jgi:hypothetical protein
MNGYPFAIDHLMVRVPDSDVAGRVFETLGFAVTPRSLLPGMSNRLVCFEPRDPRGASFVELIAVDDATAAPASVVEMLGERFGPAAIVVATADAHAFARDLTGTAAISSPLDLARDCDLGAGMIRLSFSVIVARRAGAPIAWSAIQHNTPRHYSVAKFIHHPAGDFQCASIIAVSADPSQTARALQSLWGGSFGIDEAGSVRFRLGSSELQIHSAGGLKRTYRCDVEATAKPSLVGIVLTAADPVKVADALASHAGHVIRLDHSAVLISDAGWRCIVAIDPLG